MASTYGTDQVDGTSGASSIDFIPEDSVKSSGEFGKIVRSGVPSSTFWHFVDFSGSGPFAHRESLGTDQVNAFSQVAVSMTELDSDGNPFLGSAIMTVNNVVPRANGDIIVRGHIHWESTLRVRLNYIIVN
jgi:hypothetical protein